MLQHLPGQEALAASGIRNILFDLGGVLYAIDVNRSLKAFHQLVEHPGDLPDGASLLGHPVFRAYETGDMEEPAFFESLRDTFSIEAPDEAIRAAWNEVLVGIIPGRESLVRNLAQNFRIFLLSNTNFTHYKVFEPQCRGLFSVMEGLYFSFEMGLRKPDPAIFEAVSADASIRPEATLFIDDSAGHLTGAEQAGFQTFHLENPELLSAWKR